LPIGSWITRCRITATTRKGQGTRERKTRLATPR
jgi:hypothetical protein